MGICDIKNAHLHSSFLAFNAIHLKSCNNVELTIPKKTYVFCSSDFGILAGKDVTKFLPNFVFDIMGYLMMVSERGHHKDVKSEKNFEIGLTTQKILGF